MKKNILKIGIILAVIAIGIATILFARFQFSLYYKQNVRIEIYLGKEFKTEEVMQQVKEILPEQELMIETAGVFKDTISITTTTITDEQISQIVDKLNETYETELVAEADTQVIYNSNIRGRDIFMPYLVISSIAAGITIAIITIIYGKKVGIIRTIVTSLLVTVMGQFFYFVMLSLMGIEINRMISGTAVAIFIASMVYLISQFEKMKIAKK